MESIELHGAVGSQGQAAAAAYSGLTVADREALIRFLNSLGRAQFDGDGNDVVDLVDLHEAENALIPCSMVDAIIGPDDPCAVHDIDIDGSITSLDVAMYVQAIGDLAIDCDGDQVIDVMQIFLDPFLDADQDGLLDSCTSCPGDTNGNGLVDTNDILVVLSDWGTCQNCPGDVNGDGMVGVDDIIVIIAAWGDCP